jgi:pimeloyl-ACP methyl ester carboxylesterase
MTEHMRVIHDGAQQAPAVLLLHGSGAAGSCWSPIVPALAADHHVIRVDLPGCGHSPPPTSYAVPAQAAAVASLLDDLELRDIPAIGHSSGGYVVTALVEARPDLVGSIGLISSGPALDALLPQPRLLTALMSPPLGPLLWRVRSDTITRRAIASTCARPVEIPDEAVADLRSTGYRAFRGILHHNGAYLTQRALPERLKTIDLPKLVIFGAADPRWDPASARRYEVVPNTRVEMLDGVGHLPMIEAPEETAKLLLDFLD